MIKYLDSILMQKFPKGVRVIYIRILTMDSNSKKLIGKVNHSGNSTIHPLHPLPDEANDWWYLYPEEGCYKHFVSIGFYDGNGPIGSAIKPTAGSITVEVSDNGITFGPVAEGNIDLTKPYQQPNFMGHCAAVRIKITGLAPTAPEHTPDTPIDAATTVVVNVHSYR